MGALTDPTRSGESVSASSAREPARERARGRGKSLVLSALVVLTVAVPLTAKYGRMESLEASRAPIAELPLEVSAISRDRPVIVLYVSSTCPHCHAELARLATNEALRRLSERGVPIVIIAPVDSRRMREKLPGLDVHALDDEDGAIRRRLSVRSVPAMLMFDSAGRVLTTQVGETSEKVSNAQLARFATEVLDR